jgi:hypothetical protein
VELIWIYISTAPYKACGRQEHSNKVYVNKSWQVVILADAPISTLLVDVFILESTRGFAALLLRVIYAHRKEEQKNRAHHDNIYIGGNGGIGR